MKDHQPQFVRHCEEPQATWQSFSIASGLVPSFKGLLRFARNDVGLFGFWNLELGILAYAFY
jgi:hypothetical protein